MQNNYAGMARPVGDEFTAWRKLGHSPEAVAAQLAETEKYQTAFVLACRILGGYKWSSWQEHILDRAENEQVCRVCGCTQNDACPGGCYWVEDDLCSCCTVKMKEVDTHISIYPIIQEKLRQGEKVLVSDIKSETPLICDPTVQKTRMNCGKAIHTCDLTILEDDNAEHP